MAAATAMALALFGGSAAAQEADDAVTRGAEIARQLCGPCHAIGPTGKSPNPKAPPFRRLEARLTLEGVEDVLAEEMALGHDPAFAGWVALKLLLWCAVSTGLLCWVYRRALRVLDVNGG